MHHFANLFRKYHDSLKSKTLLNKHKEVQNQNKPKRYIIKTAFVTLFRYFVVYFKAVKMPLSPKLYASKSFYVTRVPLMFHPSSMPIPC